MANKVKKKGSEGKKASTKGRTQKIIGILCIFISIYLLIAFVSYTFTWREDQDQVLQLSFSILLDSDVEVANWLGRFGAVVANFFFFWGFGVSAFLFLPIIFHFGLRLIREQSLLDIWPLAQQNFLYGAGLSVVLAAIFQTTHFPWGGAFGSNVCFWIINFLGQIGLFLLLIFGVISWFIWKYNPSLEFLELATPNGNLSIPGFLRFRINDSSEGTQKKNTKNTSHQEPAQYEPHLDDQELNKILKPSTNKEELDGELVLDLPETMIGEPSARKAMPFETLSEPIYTDSESMPDLTIATSENRNEYDGQLTIEEENEEHSDPFDPTLELSRYVYPPIELLNEYSEEKVEIDRAELEANKDQIIRTLLNYKIEITKIRATIGPTVTLYEIVPAPGVKISKIKNLEDDIALSLSALGIRIIAPIPGKGTIGIEVPNKKKQIVSFREVISSEKFKNAKMELPIALGKTISNEVFVADLAKMPHLLIAGATGQGKSVGINTVIMSLLYKKHPSQVKLVMIDPKKVELFPYSSINKHFLAYLPNEEEPIVTETSKVVYTLNSLCIEMDDRYDLLKKARARNITEYNEKFIARKLNPLNGHKFLPYIVLVIDEFADLIMTAGKEVELPIARIAQLARAIGIHLIIATQRPSVNIITGVIKANFPARLAFKVTSKIDSRTILDAGGADQLIGRGDMLLSVGGNVVRMQCAFVDTPEVEDVIKHISEQQGFPEPFFLPEYVGDDMNTEAKQISLSDLDDQFWDAAMTVVSNQHGSTSMLQRKMQLGYNRAGRIMDQMEALGIVGEAQGSKPREVLFFSETELIALKERLMNGSKN